MNMPGRIYSNGSDYRYSINGQEKTPEIAPNTTTAEFWQYDARIVRRWNVDPKPNVSISPYNCFAGNPILNIDSKGDTIDIQTHPVTDRNGNITSINVSISITGKILNNSDRTREIDPSRISNFVSSELTRLFSNQTVSFDNGPNFNITSITTNFTTVTNMDQVNPSDHLIVLVDDVDYDEGMFKQNIIGVAATTGKVAYVEVGGNSSFSCKSNWTPDYKQMGTVAVHEFLHNMGLDDLYNKPKSAQIPGNYMMSYDKNVNKPTLKNSQLKDAITSPHNIGLNYSHANEVTDSSWFDTSNSDPRNKSTQGKNGKIPLIIQ